MYRGTLSVGADSSATHQSGSQSLTFSLSLFHPLRSGGELNTGHAGESHQTGRQRLLQTSPLQGWVRDERTLTPLTQTLITVTLAVCVHAKPPGNPPSRPGFMHRQPFVIEKNKCLRPS